MAAIDAFLKLDGIAGESLNPTHKGEIDIRSWSWGMTQTSIAHTGTGVTTGKVDVSDLSLVKEVDRATPSLIRAACIGTHVKNGVLTARKAGTTPLDYLRITLTDVIVTLDHIAVAESGSGNPTEQVTLNFAAFKVEYTPQLASGAGGATITGAFDIAKNIKI